MLTAKIFALRALKLLAALFGLLIAGIIGLICFVALFNEKILEGRITPFLAPLVILDRPKDYYNPVLDQDINVKTTRVQKFTYRNKYYGYYWIYIQFNGPDSMVFQKDDYDILVNVSVKGKQLLSVVGDSEPEHGNLEKFNPVSIVSYHVPEEIPCGEKLDVELTVRKYSAKMLKNWSIPKIIIKTDTASM